MGWLNRRWQEFRWGYSLYGSFLFSFLIFILITFRDLIAYVPFLESFFSNLWFYTLCTLIFIPLFTIIGHLHRKKQLRTDIILQMEQNPFVEEVLERLERIEKKLET